MVSTTASPTRTGEAPKPSSATKGPSDLLKRSLIWAQGYALYAEYPKSIILFMDDFGTSDRTYLPYWHYRTLDEDDIRKGLIEPLKRHHAVLVEGVLTGFVDRKSHRVLNPWRQQELFLRRHATVAE